MRSNQPSAGRGFTLVELMISVALVLVLMFAISWIFGQTSSTIGTGLAAADVSREHRNSRRVLRDDFQYALGATEQPFVMISSEVVPAFMTKADRDADLDYDPAATGAARRDAIRSRDFNGDNDEADAGETRPAFVYDARNHRADRLTFFTRRSDGIQRRTGRVTMIERYANGQVPSGEDAMVTYGLLNVVANPTLPLASWAPHAPGAADEATNPQNFYASDWILGRRVLVLIPDADDTGPGATSHYASAEIASPAVPAITRGAAFSGRLDVVALDAAAMREAMGSGAFWTPPTRDDAGNMTFAGVTLNYPTETIRWTGATTPDLASRQVNQFMSGCTQFIVEFAGDYVTQDATSGAQTDTVPDGVIDFNPTTVAAGQIARKTRWYGAERDVNGDGDITAAGGDTGPVSAYAGAAVAPFERSQLDPATGTGTYVAAWTPEQLDAGLGPKMVRLTIGLIDGNGRLAEGQAIENIFVMP